MVNGSCSSDSGSGRRERLRGERFGAHSAHQYFTLPCGHGEHTAQNRFSFPCVQPTQATQLSRRLPWGHGLHVAQLSFRFPCGHRFITSRSPLYHRRPRARGRVCGATREASSFSSVNKDRFVSAEKIRRAASSSFLPDYRSRKLPSVCRRPPKWRFKIRVIKDWSTVRVERKPFRGVFSERRAPGRHKRDARRNAPCSRPKVTRLRPSHARQRHA